MLLFNNLLNDEKKFKKVFHSRIENTAKRYIQGGIITKKQPPEKVNTKKEHTLYQCPIQVVNSIKKLEKCENIALCVNQNLIDNFNRRLFFDFLKLNRSRKLKVECSIKYRIVYSIKLKKEKKMKSYEEKLNINNIYKIVKTNKSFFLNEYLVIKKVYSTEFGNFYICKNIRESTKKYFIKLFRLNTCLQKRCPIYKTNQTFLIPHFNKILDEIFFLYYLQNENIITIEAVSFDVKRNMFLVVFPYIKHQSMYFNKKYNVYSVHKKVQLIKNQMKLFLYSENFIRRIFRKLYDAIYYSLKKNVAYLDLKPENLLISEVPPNALIPISVKRRQKRRRALCLEIETEKGIKIAKENEKEKVKQKQPHCVEAIASIQTKENSTQNITTPSNYKKRRHEKSEICNCKFFLHKKRKKLKKKKRKKFLPFENINVNRIKNKKHKFICNVDASKCLLFDKEVYNIFFRKSSFDDSFHIFNSSDMFIQIFIKEDSTSVHIEKTKEKKHEKNVRTTFSESKKIVSSTPKLNKIKKLGFFRYKGSYIDFLKFYWLYYNETKEQNDAFIYLSLYFINKHYLKNSKKKNSAFLTDAYQKRSSQTNSQKTYNEKIKKKVKICEILEERGNKEASQKNENTDELKKKENNADRLKHICAKEKHDEQICRNDNENEEVTLKLIDFDTSVFKIKSQSSYNCGTYMFNSFECLFNINNKKISLLKKIAYTIGCSLYVFCFGKTPYGNTIFEIHQNMKKNKVKFPKYRKISSDLKDLLRKLLTKKAKKRLNFKKIIRHKWFTNND